MIAKINAIAQKLRWALDPSCWMIRLLGLSRFEEIQKQPGIILIQIDGLSYDHFHHALKRGYLSFIKQLRKNEGYRDWHHYSGLPSSTPAIQAELFYGVKQVVPAFKFRDHESGEIFTFYEFHTACATEERLGKVGAGLLTGGSSYCNIFSGGAKENTHFCVASSGWNAFFKALNPYSLIVLFIFNLTSIFRTIYYWVIEFILAAFDSIRGTMMGYGLREEFLFILSRLIVTVGLRELAALGVKLDIARGLPIIHANFFGYDDQAHRRGPSSRFAYWSLPGIDGCIKRIWIAAQNSMTREYTVWIYSDHGQEEVVPYAVENGRKIEDAVADIFHGFFPEEEFLVQDESKGKKHVGCREVKSFFEKAQISTVRAQCSNQKIIVTAQGPLGFIYPHRTLDEMEQEKIARALVGQARVPLVITRTNENKIHAFTQEGKFVLPEEAGRVLGEKHPYLEAVGEELKSLGHHQDAGAFILSGWKKNQTSVSFPMEYGSHAGPGPQETDGFCLLPADIRVPMSGQTYVRPLGLREAAIDFLAAKESVFYGRNSQRILRHTLRIMTYNVHSCIGMDGKLSPERIARVIARHDPDVVALQELDVGRLRTKGEDQAQAIAKLLDMNHHFHPVRMIEDEMYGNAILSRYPMEIIRAAALPRLWSHSYFEPRGALRVEIKYEDLPVQLINTHLSFWAPEQRKQAEALCGPEWLGAKDYDGPLILCGDFNAMPQSSACRSIRQRLEDAQLKIDKHKPLNTWSGHFPMGRIDHIFVSSGIEILKVEVPSTRLEKLASDHLPLITEIRISSAGALKIPIFLQ